VARQRKITADDILDATERVIIQKGAANLSIDAVAKDAGVSKSRVLYDHKSKSDLIEATLNRYLDAEWQRIQRAVAAHQDAPYPEFYGRLAVVAEEPSVRQRAVAMALSVAMANEDKLQARLRKWFEDDLHAITTDGAPQSAVLAYLALNGFFWSEMLGILNFSAEKRADVLHGIQRIITELPAPTDKTNNAYIHPAQGADSMQGDRYEDK
jgi:AcrR family transcriptional regulator